jgi:hypothetical protein
LQKNKNLRHCLQRRKIPGRAKRVGAPPHFTYSERRAKKQEFETLSSKKKTPGPCKEGWGAAPLKKNGSLNFFIFYLYLEVVLV